MPWIGIGLNWKFCPDVLKKFISDAFDDLSIYGDGVRMSSLGLSYYGDNYPLKPFMYWRMA